MADLLKRHLKKKTEEHSALVMLDNQWGFDEKLIPKALQNIGSLFPHYSRHDESHSKQILINIERLLGDNISKLTATDTWLLLEAAYWHDIGMVVPQKDIIEAFDDQKFQEHINQIKSSPNNPLYKFCLNFDSKDINKCFSGAETPIDAIDKFRQLMAEWFRIQHPKRANEIVQNPWKSIGISSPRTELIPSRLFKMLGRICHMHGLSFEYILGDDGLPYREAGLAQEDCHPRFVACLLRMGDLLDLDDNRFCPVMQRIAGDNRPSMSKAHEEKHAGIRHLRVDRERIEISSECESVDAYLETFKWFDWLKQEMQNQMAHWQDIVPSRKFGLLPTLGDIKVKLSGEQQLLTEGKKPQFSIDDEQATALLQGSNLYSTKFKCIRELLQNSVDATLLRLWLTKNSDNNHWKSPLSKIPLDTFNETPIIITLTEDKDHIPPEGETRWNLKIVDQGTGISRNDLNHMLKIGGSKRNSFRQEKINQMPEWMKPSGTFGIGFQSAFMICDEVKISTKDIFSNESSEIIMHSPTGEKEGLITIKSLTSDISKTSGTTLEISFLLEKKSSRWTVSWANRNKTLSDRLVQKYDPLLDQTFPFEATKLVDEIEAFTNNSMIPIHGSFNIDDSKHNLEEHFEKRPENWNFVEVEEQCLLLNYKPCFNSRPLHSLHATYRGQEFEQSLNFLSNIIVKIDLLSGKAGNWLTIDRDKLLESANKKLTELTLEALKKQIQKDLNSPDFINKLKLDDKMSLSYFLQQETLNDSSWKELAVKLNNAWYDLAFGDDENGTYRLLSNKNNWTISKAIDKRYDLSDKSLSKDEKDCDLLIGQHFNSNEYHSIRFLLINEWLETAGNSVKVLESEYYNEANKTLKYQFSSEKQDAYSLGALASSLIGASNRVFQNTRFLLELETTKWEILKLKKEARLSGVSYLFDIPTNNKSFVVLPFLFLDTSNEKNIRATSVDLDQLVKRLLPDLQTSSNFETIRKKYTELIEYIDYKIMKNSPFWIQWKNKRGID